jgi:hypothetical protein
VNPSPVFLLDEKNHMRTPTIPALCFSILLLFFDSVTPKDFKPAFGEWKGTLTYLDYKSGKPYTMPANITISKDASNERQLVFRFEYPNEPKANGNDTLVISDDGSKIDGADVVSKTRVGKNLLLTTEKDGVDGNDNRKATIRHIYTIGKKSFINRKEVRFEGEPNFIMRNEFKMER